MTLRLDLPAALESELRELAGLSGQDPEAYLLSLVERQIRADKSVPPAGLLDSDPEALARAVARATHRTPAQIEAARQHALATLKPRTAPPAGTNGMQLVHGAWPGTETDEEIGRSLEALS